MLLRCSLFWLILAFSHFGDSQFTPFGFFKKEEGGGCLDVGGYCWYYGTTGQSCDTVCSNAGLSCDLTGTRDYAGSGGSDANCDAVLDALGAPSTSISNSGGGSAGCLFDTFGGTSRRRITSTTTCSNSHSQRRRACACQ